MSKTKHSCSARVWQQRVRGFTLVEMLAVVAMVGILSAIGMVGYGRYIRSARVAEAKAVIGAIRASQESYRAETLTYLNCSGNLTNWYPALPGGKKKYHWHATGHANYPCWRILNVTTDSPTYFGFAVVAGAPGGIPPVPTTAQTPTWPNPTAEPWYVIQATGDYDDDGTRSLFLASSFTGDVYSENEDE